MTIQIPTTPDRPSEYWAALERTSPIGLHTTQGLPLHRHTNGLDGYIYVVALSTGLVKVGRTLNPRGRLGSHISHAYKVGVEVVHIWLSPRHENFAANERALIKSLGVAERGSEYFRCSFTHAVEIAKSLAFVIPTDAERVDRDARHAAEMKAKAHLFGDIALGEINPQQQVYQRIMVPADQAWALQMVFAQQLPKPAPRQDGDGDEVSEQVARLSAALNVPAGEVLDWSFLDLLHRLAHDTIQGAWLDLKIRALEAGRYDLTDPNYLGELDEDDDLLISEDEFSYYAEPALLIEDDDDPRTVVVGIGSKLGVESACIGVRNGGSYVDLQLDAEEVSRLIEHLSDVRDVMRTEVKA